MEENTVQQSIRSAIKTYQSNMHTYRPAQLPEASISIGTDTTRLLFQDHALFLFVFRDQYWRMLIRVHYPEDSAAVLCDGKIIITAKDYREVISPIYAEVEKEHYFRRDITFSNSSQEEISFDGAVTMEYYPDAPLPEFAYASYAWITHNQVMENYHITYWPDNMGTRCNNQLFYQASNHTYLGAAYLDLSRMWVTEPKRVNFVWTTQTFRFMEPEVLKPGQQITLSYCLFGGLGEEDHISDLLDILWKLNNQPIHVPQADMQTFLNNFFSVWPRLELTGEEPGDHYAAHFFADFYGQFPEGHYTDDQFGCSWLAYDLLKAQYFCRLYDRTGNAEYLDRARRMVNYYCYHHFIGNSKLTYPFHTGDFMKSIIPFPEQVGWGAPLDGGHIDTLAQSEMVFDALSIYEMHPEIFATNYPQDILEDVLTLQQADGHFRRRYNDRLEPELKAGWVNQNQTSQSWIPSLLLLHKLTGDERCMQAALRCGQAALFDIEAKGMFALGGGETDYPTHWDIDGYRSMLRAMLALYDATNDRKWLDAAEKVQRVSSCMMMSYTVPLPKDEFYGKINWKCTGMIATSFYGYADGARTSCTTTGNQSVVWVAYLLLQLYRATGKAMYAVRAVAAMRQVMVYQDENTLKDSKHKDHLMYTIFENNPQMSTPSGSYHAGVAQEGFSMFIDIYLFLDDILQEFGGIYMDSANQNAFGLDCVRLENIDFAAKRMSVTNELSYARDVLMKEGGELVQTIHLEANETKIVTW